MKLIHKTGIWMLGILITLTNWNCAKENEQFIYIHDSNLITQMVAKASHSSGEFRGEIHEFNKEDVMMKGSFTQQEVGGGYGLILFPISKSLEKDVDLTNIYLRATVTYDAMIDPSLSGRHNISGEGKIITITSGEGTKRQYRIRGYFE